MYHTLQLGGSWNLGTLNSRVRESGGGGGGGGGEEGSHYAVMATFY